MTRTWYQAEKLGTREQKVEYLRHKEEQERFRKMRLNADHSKSHAGHIAQSISREYSRRVPELLIFRNVSGAETLIHLPVVIHEASACGDQWDHEIKTE